MNFISPNKAGLALAVFMGLWHLLWSFLVAVKWAQSLLDFVFWIHFLRPVYTVGGFHPGVALLLIAFTSAVGYVFGFALGWLWNWVHR